MYSDRFSEEIADECPENIDFYAVNCDADDTPEEPYPECEIAYGNRY
ncbi:hypothetical protein Htur_4537 (plasmid) [Haloterrigena turkmenica DSM 5511]|uniref:Uncharacterized protein n=1 Tax=Haloterrigena turkmenica (strain ATCC 51198 / DSM 5511 / JCM 9101 / NCIMB 13204 / VKM B-1734 / 4k) TaxID=543526 RepID=D2S1U4_HALTV|nr:hypothetical protein Htur_4537 [Haloterrigena turkmenica DSM 5511]